MTLSLALPYTAVALLVIAMVRIHRGREKDYWVAYNRGWDRAEETFSSIWPIDSDGEPVLPTFPSSTPPPSTKVSLWYRKVAAPPRPGPLPPLPSQLTGSLPVGPKQSIACGTKGYIPAPSPNGMKADVTKVDG